jgi:hypothetical protein
MEISRRVLQVDVVPHFVSNEKLNEANDSLTSIWAKVDVSV